MADTGNLTVAPSLGGTGGQTQSGTGSLASSPGLTGSGWTTVVGPGDLAVYLVLGGTGLRGILATGGMTVAIPSFTASGSRATTSARVPGFSRRLRRMY
jgi:hypothetical protein